MNKIYLVAALAVTVSSAIAQTYSAVELDGGGSGNAINKGYSVGQTGQYEFGRATIWDSNGQAMDVHPSFLAAAEGPGFSNIYGRFGSISVGLGQKNDTPNQAVALVWRGTTATQLASPFTNLYASVAIATDGRQIVGWASPLEIVRGNPSPGIMHAYIWDAGTGRIVADLSDGKVMTLWGVAAGQQVGSENKRGPIEARMWRNTARSVINLHPRNYSYSEAFATDGTHQVGTVGVSVRLVNESRHNVQVLMNSPAVWSGSAASLQILPYTAPGYAYSTAVATGVSRNVVCGYGMGKSSTGTTQATHAVVWSLSQQTWIDLHDLLPQGFIESRANAVDAEGNLVGTALDANRQPHAFLWKASRG